MRGEKVAEYKRILLKLSGEALMGSQKFGYDPEVIKSICEDIKVIKDHGYEVFLVVGGGNICRGAAYTKMGIERSNADYMGMLATVINALAIQSMLESMGVNTRVQSAIAMTAICEPYIRRRALRHVEKGRLVIFAAGTGNPYFTTDSGAALRAVEMKCDLLLKGTQIDGVYSADPKLVPDATKYQSLTYREVIAKELAVMDTAAISIAKENNMPIVVFNIHSKGELLKVLKSEGNCTIIKN
jgi:uridylate kinase